jgi:hypothetical protein
LGKGSPKTPTADNESKNLNSSRSNIYKETPSKAGPGPATQPKVTKATTVKSSKSNASE